MTVDRCVMRLLVDVLGFPAPTLTGVQPTT